MSDVHEQGDHATREADPIADPGLEPHQPAPDRRRPGRRAARRAPGRDALRPLGRLHGALLRRPTSCSRSATTPTRSAGSAPPTWRSAASSASPCCCIGIGAIQWARKLMGDHEIVEMRHPSASSDERPRRGPRGVQRRCHRVRHRPPPADPQLAARCDGRARPAGRRLPARPRPAARATSSRTPSGRRACASSRTSRAPRSSPRTCEIGQLVNAEPGVFFEDGPDGEPLYHGTELLQAKTKAATILVRMHPDDITPEQGPRGLGRRRHPVLLQDLHPRRVPDLPVGAADAPPAVPVPPVDVRPGGQRQGDLRSGRPLPAPAAHHGGQRRATWWPRATSPNQSARATGNEGDPEMKTPFTSNGTKAAAAPKPNRVGAAAAVGRRAPRPRDDGQEADPQGLPRPLVLHAGRDRAVELRGPAADRHAS